MQRQAIRQGFCCEDPLTGMLDLLANPPAAAEPSTHSRTAALAPPHPMIPTSGTHDHPDGPIRGFVVLSTRLLTIPTPDRVWATPLRTHTEAWTSTLFLLLHLTPV